MGEGQEPFVPAEVAKLGEHPVDGVEIPVDRHVYINTVPGEIEASAFEIAKEVERHGVIKEPEIGREEKRSR